MTGVAVNILTVLVEMMIDNRVAVVRFFRMTITACEGTLHRRRGRTPSADFVVACIVALGTLKVQAPHMDIAIAFRIQQLARKIGMLDGFAATAVKMALAAGGPCGMPHILRHQFQINLLIRQSGPCGCFYIGSRGIVTDQAVDLGLVCEVK